MYWALEVRREEYSYSHIISRMKTHITISGSNSDKILNQHWEGSGQERWIVGWSGHVGA